MIKSDMLDYIAKSRKLLGTHTWYLEDETEELLNNLIGKWKREKEDDATTKSKLCSTTNKVPEKEPDGIVW